MRCGILFVVLVSMLPFTLPVEQSIPAVPCAESGAYGGRLSDSPPAHGVLAGDAGTAGRASGEKATDSLPALESILGRYIEALGGREAIESLETRKCTGWLVTDLPSRTPPVFEKLEIETYSALPDKWLLVGHGSSGTLRNGFDGERGWDQTLSTVKPEPRMERGKLAFLINPHGALRIGDYFRDMTVTGTADLNGRECYAVESDRKASSYTLYFDVEKTAWRSHSAPLQCRSLERSDDRRGSLLAARHD